MYIRFNFVMSVGVSSLSISDLVTYWFSDNWIWWNTDTKTKYRTDV